jgi:hypothetical protein
LVFHPEALAFNDDGVGMMQQPIQDRGASPRGREYVVEMESSRGRGPEQALCVDTARFEGIHRPQRARDAIKTLWSMPFCP